MLQLTVALPSGHNASVSIPEASKVGDLKALAQESLSPDVSYGSSLLKAVSSPILTKLLWLGFEMETSSQWWRSQSWQQVLVPLLYGDVEATGLSHGGMETVVVTALQSKIS